MKKKNDVVRKLINFDTKKNVLVSILVPICNVEKYLSKCLDSIEAQTLKEIEVLCINDGSKDSSLDIIKKYASRDKRFKVIDKVNSGYGDSLNIGLKMASGKYIGIVESDDYIEPNMFETLYSVAEEKCADVVKSNFYLYWENGKDGNSQELNELHEFASIDEDRMMINPLEYKSGKIFSSKASIWSAIYERKFLNNNGIEFLPTPGASFQDTSFTFKVFSSTEKMVIIHDAFLHYRQDNAGSSVNNLDKKKHCVIEEYREIFNYIKKNGDSDDMLMVAAASFYDASIWAYERLSEEHRFEYINELSDIYKDLLNKIPADRIPFGECWWKSRDIERIARNPLEYHVWREVERYEQNNGAIEFVEEMKKNSAYLSGKKLIKEGKNEPKFSIIIPAYNCEHYLLACLESVRNQSYDNYEVIAVNDGSSDDTLEILKYYSAIDGRFIYIDIENHGPSYARNIGIENAKGEYILFLDSDDFYNVDSLENLEKSIKEPVDVVSFSANVYPLFNFNEWYEDTLHGKDNSFGKLTVDDILANPYLGIYIWKVAYNREFLKCNGLRFDETMDYGEDAMFLLKVLLEANKTISMKDELYNYRVDNTSSLMQTIMDKPNEYALTQISILNKTLKLMFAYETKPTKELFEYCCNFVYGSIDKSFGETRKKVIKSFLRILKKYKLDKCVTDAKESAVGFYNYCLEFNSFKLRISKQKVYRPNYSIKKIVRRIFPVSRQAYYDYETKKMDYLERQIQAIYTMQNEINTMQTEIARLNNILAQRENNQDIV